MKNTIAALVAVIAAVPAAAVPDVVTYAARVENDAGPFSGTVSAVFQLFDAPTGGALLWSENVASVVVVDGDLVHDLGSVDPLDDSVLARDAVFLAVTFNGDALSPRAAIRSVPFALRAREAETLAGLSADDIATDDELDAAVDGITFATLPGVPGSLADGQVSFSELSGVPTALVDGQISVAEIAGLSPSLQDNVDNDTLFTAGAGLKLNGTAFSIADNAISLSNMNDNAVSSAEIVDNSIVSADIKDGQVSGADLADSSITSLKIVDGSLTTADLGANSVGTSELAVASVTKSKLSGTEVEIFIRQPFCTDPGSLSSKDTCKTDTCLFAGQARFFNCDATCGATTSQSCTNATLGFLIGADALN